MSRLFLKSLRWIALSLCAASAIAQAQTPLEVVIDGVEDELLDNVRLVMSIEQQKNSPALIEGRIRRLHHKAPMEIRQALEPYGYYRVKLESSLRQEDATWHAHYIINKGEQIPVRSSDITITGEARDDPEFIKLMESHPFEQGKPFVHLEYEQFKRSLNTLAEERGYLSASFVRHEVQVDPINYYATVSLRLESGPRYRFGEISFTGTHPFTEEFLTRYLKFSTGDYYEQHFLNSLQKALFASDYFEKVDVIAERGTLIDHLVPITVTLQQRPRNRYQFGIGYGTDTGLRGMVGHERRWLNPEGHRFSSELRVSEILSSVTAQHSVPLSRPESDRMVNRAEYHLDTGGDIDSRKSLISSSIERSLNVWRTQWGISYQLEDFEIGLQSGDSTLLVASASWNSIRGYDVLGLLRGLRIGLGLRGASKEIVSDTDFIQAHLNAKSIIPLGEGRILLRGEAATTAVETFEQLPPSMRYFAGGDNSIRGFAYRDVGPTDASGDVIGGRHLLVGSIEYDYPINNLWRAALFLDGGNAFDSNFVEAEKGVGIGVRRQLPIGQLRIDVAEAISRPGRPWRLHLTMGLEL